ncbi:sodium/potassium/calcium exchanger 1 [Cebidichthys violaceus]|uniref:sodium/potassium/calcium exchanger 1 n=1 Tax=Cebidichthys violaceus TaxID=271503 RepID=UPI0035CAD77E
MNDGHRTEAQAEVSRQELYEDYVNYYLQPCPEVRPCCDPSLLKKAAQYLLREPEPGDAFTVFPFYRAVRQDCVSQSTHGRKHLHAFIKATELLETLCVNLFVQPWKKEIKTLKTFTGPFIYGLLPVLSSSTIQSVLGSIGYLPHTDAPQSEYRLSEDANPDRAMLLGFELLLARVECDHLLEILEKDQLGPQEFLEVLQRRMGSTKLDEPTEKKTIIGQKEEENKKMEEVPLCLDIRPAVKPQPKPRSCRLSGIDQSIMEMQMTYPDLAFRGRPLLPDKPQRANGSSKDVHTVSANDNSGDGEAAEVPKIESIKGTKVSATTIRSKNDGGKADEVFGDDRRGSGCSDRNSGGSAAAGDGSRDDGELRGPQAISLHITLRAASTAEQSLKHGEARPTAEPPAWTQQQTVADLQNKRPANSKLPSLSSMDEEQELRQLAESMCQFHVQETKKEVKRKEENKREEGNTNKERSQTEREANTEAEEENLGKPVMTGPALSHAASRSSQFDPAVMEEQKQHTVCHHSTLAVGTKDCQSCKGGDDTEQQEVEDTVRAETGRDEEQLTKSFVIVEHHKK